MVRSPCFAVGMNKGLWTAMEDKALVEYVETHGAGKWPKVSKVIGLKRNGKSCRLRWINYLSPDIKRGHISQDEEDLIIRLHKLLGNRWSLIAGRLPGRTDNEVKNYWNTNLSKRIGVLNKKDTKKHKQHQPLSVLCAQKMQEAPTISPEEVDDQINSGIKMNKNNICSYSENFMINNEEDIHFSRTTETDDLPAAEFDIAKLMNELGDIDHVGTYREDGTIIYETNSTNNSNIGRGTSDVQNCDILCPLPGYYSLLQGDTNQYQYSTDLPCLGSLFDEDWLLHGDIFGFAELAGGTADADFNWGLI